MSAYYNENDPYCAQWLRNLIEADLIAPGDVDDRSIADVRPADVAGYRQCHWFAGIGGWSLAARLAGWPDDRELWTGSCPCQPFSAAGKRKGAADARHLWPEFARLIGECKPPVLAGEQVASKDGRLWLAGVFADLEALGYQRAGADLCAAGVAAPHIRQRLYWVAESDEEQCGWIADAEERQFYRSARRRQQGDGIAEHGGPTRRMADADSGIAGNGRSDGQVQREALATPERETAWGSSITIACADGKARRVEPTIFPLAHAGEWGIGSRVGLLRGSGNAIVPQVAAEFLGAYMDCRP